jgi:CheY-like chemotaxis protein
MLDSSKERTEDLSREVDALRDRLRRIAASGEVPLRGMPDVLAGLDAMLEELVSSPLDARALTQVSLLTHGLDAVASFLEVEDGDDAPTPTPSAPAVDPAGGLQQFIAAFQQEAKKRMSGLSLSMMNIFHEDAADSSLEASAGHLHAIRGGAAMLNLTHVAQLSGLMERVIVAMRRVPASERDWPTQALLRGYHLLKTASDDPAVYIDPDAADDVCADLRDTFDALAIEANTHHDAKPAAPAPSPDTSAAPATPAEPAGPLEQRILIVDDVETIAASVGFVLSELDLPLDIAQNGEQALSMMRKSPYSLVISDIAMPRLDGIALTRMMREDPALNSLPVILLTSLDHPSERDAGLEAGANDYIIKGSIGGGELISRVRDLLEIAPFVPAARAREPRRRLLVAEDTETVAASIAFVLSEAEIDIVLASDGAEALAKLQREPFDLLISDWQMPSMTGIELIEAARADPATADLPIILLTSLDSDTVRDRALDAGANRFLVKGQIGGGALLALVEELIAQP